MSTFYDPKRYEKLVEATFDKVRQLGVLKGGEYAGDADRLANFRRNAEACGVTIETCWRIYAGKHWDAVTQYIKDLQTGKTRERLEGLDSRVDDLIVYLLLFKCMLEERGMINPLMYVDSPSKSALEVIHDIVASRPKMKPILEEDSDA